MFSSLKVSQTIRDMSVSFQESKIVDLGSGWGTLALSLARANPNKTVVGYELSTLPFYFSKLLKLLFRQKNLAFIREDFFNSPFQEDTLYLCYLYPKAMEKIAHKIDGSPIKPPLISSTFALPFFEANRCIKLRDLYSTPIYLYATVHKPSHT